MPPSNDRLTPAQLIHAYTSGAFPMAESRDSGELDFYQPHVRGVFDLNHVRVPRRLARTLRSRPFTFLIDQDFDKIIAHCAIQIRRHEPDTWINQEIERAFGQLHTLGHAHCISAHDNHGTLVGGLYGLHLGGVFFGESMFSIAPNASKACLIALFAALKAAGFEIIDAQMPNPHLNQFGLQEWPNESFLKQLPRLLSQSRPFPPSVDPAQIDQFLQSTTHTS